MRKTTFDLVAKVASDIQDEQDRISFIWTEAHPGSIGIIEAYDDPWVTLLFQGDHEAEEKDSKVQQVILSDIEAIRAVNEALTRVLAKHAEKAKEA